MTNPVFVDAVPPAKANARAFLPFVAADAATVRSTNYDGTLLLFVRSLGSWFVRDTTDTTGADNGSTIIVGPGGERWKVVVGLAGDIAIDAAARAVAAADDAEIAAGLVAAASGVLYEDVAAGEAATTDGDPFLVQGAANGDIFATLYRNDSGTGVSQNVSLPSSVAGTAATYTASNLYNASTSTDGSRLFANGSVSANASYTLSEYILVDENTFYSRNQAGGVICFYTSAFTLIGTGVTTRQFITPATTKYIRVGLVTTNKATHVVNRGRYTAVHAAPVAARTVPKGIITPEAIVDAAMSGGIFRPTFGVNQLNLRHLARDSINLFDKDGVTPSQLLQSGSITQPSATVSLSDYIPVDGSTAYTRTAQNAWEEYNSDGTLIASHASGGGATITTHANARWVRFSVQNTTLSYYMFVQGSSLPANLHQPYRQYAPGITTGRLYGKTVVFVGDSNVEGSDHPTRIMTAHGGLMINGGFGGTRMGVHSDAGYNGLSFYTLSEQIASGDFTAALASAELIYDPPTNNDYNHNIVALLEWVDFTSVDGLVIDYGSNDWGGEVPIGTWGGGADATGATVIGAMRYGIETILTARPGIQLLFKTPSWRVSSASPNGLGLYLSDYADAIIETAAGYNLPPVLDLNRHSGINSITDSYYLIDDAHYSEAGKAMAATKIGSWLIEHV